MVMFLSALILLLTLSFPGKAEVTYMVQSGDTLTHIARDHGIAWNNLADFNNVTDPSRLRIGTVLRIPGVGVRDTSDLAVPAMGGSVYSIVGPITAQDKLLLGRLVYAESRGESLAGQIAVAAVVLNRVASPLFPDTIREVIYQPRQFTPVETNRLPDVPNGLGVEAARRALAGQDPSGGALFFYNPRISAYPEYWETRTIIKQIGNHNFAL